MFVIVDLSDERKRRFEKYRKHIIETRRCDVFGSAPFFIARGHRLYYNPDELEGIIRRCGTALFREGEIPDGFEKYCFTPSVLPLRMAVKTAALFFKEQPFEKRNITVSVFDRYGCAKEELLLLSRYVRFVRIITERPDAFSDVSQRAYGSFGTVISVERIRDSAPGSDMVIALSDSEFSPACAECALVYEKNSVCDNVFALKESSFLPDGYEKETEKINRFLFLCALFETCGYRITEIPVFSDAKSILLKTFT